MLRELLPYALPVAPSPLPAIAAIMVLLAPAGMRGGAGLLAGRALTLFVLLLLACFGAAALGWGAAPDRPWLQTGAGLPRARLEAVRGPLLRHNSLLIAGVLGVIGLSLLAKGLSGL